MNLQDRNGDDSTIVELTKEGYSLFKQDRLDEAEGRFKAVLDLNGENAYALSGMGDIARRKKDFTTALQYFSACLKAHPDNNYALFGTGDCHRGMNDFRKAIEIWNLCLDRDQGNASIITNLADAYRKLFDFNKAKEHYLQALQADPYNEHALKGIGYLYYDFKLFREAIPYWNELVQRDETAGQDTQLLALLGTCYRRVFDFTMALSYYEKILAREPGGFPGNFGMADCHRGLGDFKKAIAYYDIILRSEPDNQSILTRAGDMYVNLDEIGPAKRCFEKALEIGDDIYARFGFVRIQKKQGNFREALRLLKEMDTRYPDNRRIQSEIAECERKLG